LRMVNWGEKRLLIAVKKRELCSRVWNPWIGRKTGSCSKLQGERSDWTPKAKGTVRTDNAEKSSQMVWVMQAVAELEKTSLTVG